MTRRILCLLALLFVADAIGVNGRAPRPITISGQQVFEAVRIARMQTAM